ncbi:LuxR C-terminal-related transcriptional regulator [Mycobacterium sp.]|uniref:helix-turn-helix transcriptional regulator n=1 Tax=Mycobacterium sp. TaxID=1785 RepID=UPI0025F555BE|nr:LuxR C-terminal-related transcriptional regulator [Mycobacterium sp.]
MAVRAASRHAEEQCVVDFLDAVPLAPTALVIEGDPGIGKTTLWLGALEQARERGFTVLASRSARAESVLAYATLADLLSGIDESVWADLPLPQQQSLAAALLRHRDHAGRSDSRAVAAAFVGVLDRLAARSEGFVLIAIDDLQWVDVSSANVVAFAARRFPRGVGLVCTTRSVEVAARVELAQPDAVRRVRLQPLTVGDLHRVLTLRLGFSVPRPTLLRIHQIAGGNPFYGLELAREMDTITGSAEVPLPGSLNELVSSRLKRVGDDAKELLLAMASVPNPTLRLLADATDSSAEGVLETLGEAENQELIAIDGNRLSFVHPVLAHGVYSDASPRRRRAMHRRLAELVVEPELRARHLALSDATGNRETIEALDAGAEIALSRGAPAAAAELLDLAINLGADDPARRILCALHYFAAGDTGRARHSLEQVVASLPVGSPRPEALLHLAMLRLHEDGFIDAAELLENGLPDRGADDPLRIRMLTMLSYALFNAAQHERALDRVEQAVTEAEQLGVPSLLSSALGMHEILGFLTGRGFDPATMAHAVDLQDDSLPIPLAFLPSMQRALLRGWTGEFDHAREVLRAAGQRCVALGQESELIFVAFSQALMDIWRGDLQSVAITGDEAVERAAQLGGDFPMFIALTIRGAAAAYFGRVDDATSDLDEAIATAQRCGSMRMGEWPATLRGFVENSRGDHQAALRFLEPLLAMSRALPDATEIIAASHLPETVEALVGVGRLDEAESYIDSLEANGRRLDRAWMLATALRCRAMLLAAQGDVSTATEMAEQAMAEHSRLPMPFERARTQLLLGQLKRRQRRREAGTVTLREALHTFEDLGTELWADRARAELARGTSGRQRTVGLTPSETRVAELAVTGMTNRDIAAALFISPKTVEVNLSRIYRKLKIRSRVELYLAWQPGDSDNA